MSEINHQVDRLVRPYAGVTVKHITSRAKNRYIITDEAGDTLVRIKSDTLIRELPRDAIIDDNKQPIPPSGRYFITAETHDPYHIVIDLLDNTAITYVGLL